MSITDVDYTVIDSIIHIQMEHSHFQDMYLIHSIEITGSPTRHGIYVKCGVCRCKSDSSSINNYLITVDHNSVTHSHLSSYSDHAQET